jgi:threonine dehydratase
VSEQSIAAGMAFLYKQHRMVVEGAAATPVAALFKQGITPGSHVILIISGNNVDTASFHKIVASHLQS